MQPFIIRQGVNEKKIGQSVADLLTWCEYPMSTCADSQDRSERSSWALGSAVGEGIRIKPTSRNQCYIMGHHPPGESLYSL